MTIARTPQRKLRTPTPKEIAVGILAELELPDDLRGRLVNLVKFPDEASCRLFHSDLSLKEHEAVCAFVRAEIRRRGGETCRTLLNLTAAYYDRTERMKLARTFNYLVPSGGLSR